MKKSIAQGVGITFFSLFLLSGCGQNPEVTKEPSAQKPNTQEQGLGGDQQMQVALEQTLDISKNYAALRYRTDNVLMNAEEFTDYDPWNNEMLNIIQEWETLGNEAADLEKLATEMAEEKISFNLIPQALAYDKKEISDIFDKAPAGKKIATLAKHLGVDAKMAFKILQQDQAQVEADAWNEAGDTLQKLETSAVLIKDGCKVAGFVGTIALTGGTAAIVSGSALGQAAVVVSGADLVLEVTSDGASIALGNNNKISAIVGNVRTVTEPLSSILMIADLPKNLTKGIEKLNAVVFGADQLNGTIQSGSVIGIKLPTPTKERPEPATEVSVLEKEEVEKWINENGGSAVTTEEDMKNILGIDSKEKEVVENKEEEKVETEITTPEIDQPQETESSNIEQPQENATGSVTGQGTVK